MGYVSRDVYRACSLESKFRACSVELGAWGLRCGVQGLGLGRRFAASSFESLGLRAWVSGSQRFHVEKNVKLYEHILPLQ